MFSDFMQNHNDFVVKSLKIFKDKDIKIFDSLKSIEFVGDDQEYHQKEGLK